MTTPKPIRLTRKRALALLAVFDTGLNVSEEGLKLSIKLGTSADEMKRIKAQDHALADARDAAAIIRSRYAREQGPTPPPSLF